MNKEACFPDGLRRGAWTDEEDKLLSDDIAVHGVERWRTLPAKAGLNRCGKSCRLRWLNYLRPGIKKGNITEEEELIVRLHKLIGNRWSLIAGRIPGRTDNEIKNYWNTYLKKKIAKDTFDSQLSSKASPTPPSKEIPSMEKVSRRKREDSNMVQAKAYPCTKGLSRIEEGSLPAPPLDLGLCRELCFDDSVMGDVCSGSRLEESEEFDY